ncbi:lytic transglycosylase [Corticibacter populi]|uniref:lytic transglycosylase n=1 Tax=Corticibacter populi TaxID=1550736 RepID=UPI00102C06A7|nr:lytic transglycosylase [Corticibacter populi]
MLIATAVMLSGGWSSVSASSPVGQTRMILPQGTYKRIVPLGQSAAAPASTPVRAHPTRPQPAAGQVPWAYAQVAAEHGLPAWALYGVALQESRMKFGERVLPFPWTLCVRGRGERYRSHAAALDALQRHIRTGITNVDCGSMQVNWHWHGAKFASKSDALDHWTNLRVGASILQGLYQARRDWLTAFKLYHIGSERPDNRERGNRYARSVVRQIALQGVDTRQLLGVTA